MTAAATPAQPPIPTLQHRVILTDNIRLDDPAMADTITGDAFLVLSRWLKDLIGVDIQPATLKNLLASLPVTGSVFSAFDVIADIRTLATYSTGTRQWGYQTIPPWIETSLDVIGILPMPPLKQASMGLKSAIKMALDPKFVFSHMKAQTAGFMAGGATLLLEDIANTHMKQWEADINAGFGKIIGGTITTVDAVARMPQARALSAAYTFITRRKDPAEEIKDLLNDVNKTGAARIKEILHGGSQFAGLAPLLLAFTKQHKRADIHVPKTEVAKTRRTSETEARARIRPAAPDQVNTHTIDQNRAITTKARVNGRQSPTAAPECKSCKTPHPINLATGEEILPHTDFAAPGLLPVAWTRCYRSSHSPYDHSLLGARWTSPYTTAITQTAQGLVYHDPTGRNIALPALGIGQTHEHAFEAFTVLRDSATSFVIAYRNGDSDVFRHHGDPAQDAQGNVAMRYALRSKRTQAGAALWILPLPEARARFRHHPAAALLAQDALLIVTDGHQLWLECRPADTGSFVADSPAAKRIISGLAALHDANQQAGIAHIAGDDPERQPGAYHAQLSRAIGRIDQLLSDGTRHTHARYRYAPATGEDGTLMRAQAGLDLVEQVDAEDHTRHYAYAAHLLTRYTDYNGFGQNLEWQTDPAWAPFPTRCIRTVADDGSEDTRLAYDAWHNETTLTDAAGNKTVYTCNGDNLVTGIETTAADGSHPFAQRIWDRNGNLVKEIDPEGRSTHYTYDDRGNLLAVRNPGGAQTRYEYDAGNNPIKIVDPAGKAWQRQFDPNGNLVGQTDPAGRRTGYTHDDLGRLTAIQDARGGKKRLAYNDASQLVSSTDCSGRVTRYSYNQLGHLTGSTDAARQSTYYDTDKLGRVNAVTRPDGSKERFHYDANDNLTSSTDANGNTTRYFYNPQGLLTTRIDPNGHRLGYRYDKNLQLLQLVNQNGDTTDFSYDAQGNLTRETGFDGKCTRYEYSHGGQLTASISGQTRTEYTRDDLGQLLEKTVLHTSGGGTSRQSTRYQYDILGKLTGVRNPQGEIHYGYNDAGHLTEERQHVKLKVGKKVIERVFTLKHALDELGNRIDTTLPNGRKVGTQRYGSGHWIGTLWNGAPLVDLERDELHREKARQLGRMTPARQDRLQQTRRYDPLSRLVSQRLNHERDRIAARNYQYDPLGNLTQIEDLQRDKIRYEYDPVGQLLKATQPNLVETFAFDPAGNMTDGAPSQAAQHANTAGKDHDTWEQGLGHLTEQPRNETTPMIAPVTRNLLKHYLNMTFEHDAEGNTVRKIVKGGKDEQPYSLYLTYDAENRLAKVSRPRPGEAIEAEYRYDAFGRRTAKIVRLQKWMQATGTHGGAGDMQTVGEDVTFFVWDGDVLVQEIRPDTTISYLYEPDSFVPLAQVHSDTPDSAYDPEAVQQKQTQEEERAQQEEDEAEKMKWLAVTDANAHALAAATIEERNRQAREEDFARLEREAKDDRMYFVHADHLGTPQEVVSEEGKVVWLARYRAWGRIYKLDKEEIAQPFRFQGQYEDAETGLFYNRYRYYDPDSARYLTQDPVGLMGGENPYRYVKNPSGWVDPLGLSPCKLSPLPSAGHLYRGVAATHPALPSAKEGIAAPALSIGGASAAAHNEGGHSGNSQYTSWTRDVEIARWHANKAGPGGVVLSAPHGAPKPGDCWSWEMSDDIYNEQEVLLKGRRTGLGVHKP